MVPAAAVITAPIAYVKVVLVKKLIVGSRYCPKDHSFASGLRFLLTECLSCKSGRFTLKKKTKM